MQRNWNRVIEISLDNFESSFHCVACPKFGPTTLHSIQTRKIILVCPVANLSEFRSQFFTLRLLNFRLNCRSISLKLCTFHVHFLHLSDNYSQASLINIFLQTNSAIFAKFKDFMLNLIKFLTLQGFERFPRCKSSILLEGKKL